MPLTVAQLTARLTADTSGFYRAMAVANSAMVRTGGIASRVFAGVGIAAGAMALLSLREAGNFEQAMNVMQAVSHATDQEMGKVQKTAIALGRDLKLPGVTARDAAEAMTQLAKGGFTVKQAIAAARGTLQLGTAAQISYGEAADMTTRTLKMFSLGADQASRVANVLAAGANASTATMTDMAYGLMNAGATATDLGISLEETVGSLAMLVDAGLSGERAGTALSTMFYRLAAPTEKAAALMGDLNIEAFNADGSFRGLQPTIQSFAKATEHMGEQQRLAAFKTIFGLRANQAMMKLLREGGRVQEDYTKAVTGTRAAQELAEARMKGFNGALEKVANAVSTLALELGLKMIPWATRATEAIAEWINSLDADEIAARVVQVVGPVVSALRDLVSFAAANRDWLLPMLAGVYTAVKVFQGLRLAMLTITAMQAALAAGWLAAFWPVALVAVAIGALVAAFIYAYTHFESFRNLVDGIVSTVLPALAAGFQWVKEQVAVAVEWLRTNVPPAFEAIASAVSTAWEKVRSSTTSVWGWIGPYIMNHLSMLKGIYTGVWTALSGLVQAHFGLMLAIIKNGFTIIVNLFKLVGAVLRGDWSAAWEAIQAIGRAHMNIIQALIRAWMTAMGAIIRGGAQIIVAIVNGLWNQVKQATMDMWNAIKSVVRTQVAATAGAIKEAGDAVVDAAVALGGRIVNGVMSGLASLPGRVKGAIESAVGSALSSVNIPGFSPPEHAAAQAIGIPLADGVVKGFLNGTRELPKRISDRIREALEAGKRAVEAARSKFEAAFSQLASASMAAFDRQMSNYKTPAEKALEAMDLEDRVNRINDAIAKAQEGLAKAMAGGLTPAEQEKLNHLIREHGDAVNKVSIARQKLTELEAKGVSRESAQWRAAAQAVTDAEQKVADYQAQIDKLKASGAADPAEIAAAQEALDAALRDKQRFDLEQQAARERAAYEEKMELKRYQFERELEQLEAHLARTGASHQRAHRMILALYRRFGIDYRNAGGLIGRALAAGIRDSMRAVEAAAREIAAIIRRYLGTNSPTELGPMSDLDHWWDSLATTLVGALDHNALWSAITGALQPPAGTTAGLARGVAAGAVTGGAAAAPCVQEITVNVNPEGHVLTERNLVDMVARGLRDELRRTPGFLDPR